MTPSRTGGGFDLTCGLASQALQAVSPGRTPLRTRYLPGGIGAEAFDPVGRGLMGGPGTLVAFSSGSLLNLAQGRFGPRGIWRWRHAGQPGLGQGRAAGARSGARPQAHPFCVV